MTGSAGFSIGVVLSPRPWASQLHAYATDHVADLEVIVVRDQGPGVPAQDAERVFDRFYRSAGDRSRASGGTGLGLSIVAALVAAHGGSVTVTGAEFTVRLPLAAQ